MSRKNRRGLAPVDAKSAREFELHNHRNSDAALTSLPSSMSSNDSNVFCVVAHNGMERDTRGSAGINAAAAWSSSNAQAMRSGAIFVLVGLF
jgi:hypothetical protein